MASVKSPEADLTKYLEEEGGFKLSSTEERLVVPLLIKFRKEHRRWDSEGRPMKGRTKLDGIKEQIVIEVPDPDRRICLVNLVLKWHK